MLTIYTEALLRFFSQIRWGGRPVPVVNSGPSRAHAHIKEWLEKQRGIKVSKASGEQTTPYPYIAVWRDPFAPVAELQSPATYRFAKDIEHGYGFSMRKPKAVKAGIDVNIYVKNVTQRDFIEYQFHTLFPQGHGVIPIDYGDTKWYKSPNEPFAFAKVLGKQYLRITLDSLTDNSTLEDGGLAGRTIRLTATGDLFGWIPFQPYAVPLVYTLEYLVCDENGQPIQEVVYDEEQV